MSGERYNGLLLKSQQSESIVEFFRKLPLAGIDLDLERDKDTGRDIEL
jgi:hypothetical protein